MVSEVDRIDGQWQDYPSRLLVGLTDRLMGRDDEADRKLAAALFELESDIAARPEDARLRGALGLALTGFSRHLVGPLAAPGPALRAAAG